MASNDTSGARGTIEFASADQMNRQLTAWGANCGAPAFAFAQYDHIVQFARIDSTTGRGSVDWAQPEDALPEFLLDIRVFGPEAEYHAHRSEIGFVWRRADASSGQEQFDARHALWGSSWMRLRDGWWRTSEERGIAFDIPISAKPAAAAYLVLRHMVMFDEDTGLAYVADSRLTGVEV